MHSVCVPQRFLISQMRLRLDCARENSAAQVRVHVHLRRILGTALILPRIQGGSDAPPQPGPETSHLWQQPTSPSRCWPGSRATEFRVIIVKICRTPEPWEAFSLPNLRRGLIAPPRLVARPFLGQRDPSRSTGYQPKG